LRPVSLDRHPPSMRTRSVTAIGDETGHVGVPLADSHLHGRHLPKGRLPKGRLPNGRRCGERHGVDLLAHVGRWHDSRHRSVSHHSVSHRSVSHGCTGAHRACAGRASRAHSTPEMGEGTRRGQLNDAARGSQDFCNHVKHLPLCWPAVLACWFVLTCCVGLLVCSQAQLGVTTSLGTRCGFGNPFLTCGSAVSAG
jgi:hypothetical protein